MKNSQIKHLVSAHLENSDNRLAMKMVEAYPQHELGMKLVIIEALMSPHEQDLRLVMIRLQADPDEGYQNLFLRIFEKFEKNVMPRTHFHAWARTMARNEILNQKLKKSYIVPSDVPLENVAQQEDEIKTTQKGSALRSAMSDLPPLQKKILSLRYFSGTKNMTYKDIASELNLTVGQVKGHLDRGKNRLRELLSA